MSYAQPARGAGPKLRAEHLTREVAGKRIVDDVSVEVAAGEVVAIVGPSGAGKSSFLRLLNRLDEPTAGTVYLDGQDYRQIPSRVLRRRIGMVLQAPYLFPGTVADNVRYGPRQAGENLPERVIDELLQRVRLPGYALRDVSALSGGEAQRVSLARTLANSPEVLLLDEPTSALDPETEADVEGLIRSILEEQGLTCLVVTHHVQQALRLAQVALVLRDGKLAQFGPAKETLDAQSVPA